ncbi:CD1375 family protein [Methanocorpusculum vombati]
MVNEAFARAYATLIRAGRRTLDQVVGTEMRERVSEILSETE